MQQEGSCIAAAQGCREWQSDSSSNAVQAGQRWRQVSAGTVAPGAPRPGLRVLTLSSPPWLESHTIRATSLISGAQAVKVAGCRRGVVQLPAYQCWNGHLKLSVGVRGSPNCK